MACNQNYRKHLAIITDRKRLLYSKFGIEYDGAGIYLIRRTDENGKKIGYVGQSKHVLTRLAEHLIGYQAIDLSIKKHGLCSLLNPRGYFVEIIRKCENNELDRLEREYINYYLSKGYELKNIAGGGQKDRAEDVGERKPTKTYMDGLHQGRKNAIKEVAEYFEKYLDFSIKEPKLTKKGSIILKKQKKYEEFKKLLVEQK